MQRMKIPPTTKRVKESTCSGDNKKIEQKTVDSINLYKGKSMETLTKRIEQLDKEWDTERVLESNAATLILFSSLMGLCGRRRWSFLSGIVSSFLLLHAVFGWCPPLPIIRKLGIRTSEEIFHESMVMRYSRGDFCDISKENPTELFYVLKK